MTTHQFSNQDDCRPHFDIPALIAIPSELLALPADMEITWSRHLAGFSSHSADKVGGLIAKLTSEAIEQAKGNFSVPAAAQVLADALRISATRQLESMEAAIVGRALTLMDGELRKKREPRQYGRPWGLSDYLRAKDIDAWLAAEDADYRFPAVGALGSAAEGLSSVPARPASTAEITPRPQETKQQREDRRCAVFEQRGGRYVPSGRGLKLSEGRGLIEQIAAQERSAGYPASDTSDVGKEIRAGWLRKYPPRNAFPGIKH